MTPKEIILELQNHILSKIETLTKNYGTPRGDYESFKDILPTKVRERVEDYVDVLSSLYSFAKKKGIKLSE